MQTLDEMWRAMNELIEATYALEDKLGKDTARHIRATLGVLRHDIPEDAALKEGKDGE